MLQIQKSILVMVIAAMTSTFLSAKEPVATPVSSITIPSGFKVERLRSAGKGEDSWISMTFDDKGRIILGLDSKGLGRVTLNKDIKKIKFEIIEKTFKHSRGVLYAHHSLYVSATNSKGFYRLKDTNGDDQFDEVKLLKKFDYRSRYGHGSNQVVLGPDNMIYLVSGNDIAFPEGVSPTSPYQNPLNDHLLPNPNDAGQDNRVGSIMRFDRDGKICEVVAGGFRNQFDMAFNADGEMFTFDADMEWDAGLPWYRPTRINHVISGGEYGWRWGTGKWPEYYADSLPSTLNTGLGSPTGTVFGTKSNFPKRYRNALFMADWQNGRILLVDLKPKGATYECEYQVFLEGGPLNVCDMEFGPDGTLYFITGGRGSQSGLYKVTANKQGKFHKPAPVISPQQIFAGKTARQLRKRLEKFHQSQDDSSIDFIWKHLSSKDRWLRFSARIALENQKVSLWRDRSLNEKEPTAAIAGLLALCHQGNKQDQPKVFNALQKISFNKLKHQQLLALLRTYQLCCIRLGRPNEQQAKELCKLLHSLYPHASNSLNHLAGELLIYLKDDLAIEGTLTLLTSEYTQEEQIRAAQMLTLTDQKWTLNQKQTFLKWLIEAKKIRNGGKLIGKRMKEIRDDYVKTLSAQDLKDLSQQVAELQKPLIQTTIDTPKRPLVKHWKIKDLESQLTKVETGRSFKNGKQALMAASCLKCHRIGTMGGQIGPDLTAIGKRFDSKKILESIIEPSAVMDPKYRNTSYVMESGKIITGRPIGISKKAIKVQTDPLQLTVVEVIRAEIDESVQSKTSPMPTGLIDVLTPEEILDLIAYLISGGKPDAKSFGKKVD